MVGDVVQAGDSGQAAEGHTFVPELSVSHPALLREGHDERFRHVLFLARSFADRLAIFRDTVAQSIGLTGNQYAILLAIAHAQRVGGITVGRVAEYSLMATTHVTTQVGTLVKKGLVKKVPHPEDKRSVLLMLAPKGEKVMMKVAPLRRQFNDAYFSGVTYPQLCFIEKFFEKMIKNSEVGMLMIEQLSKGDEVAGGD